MSALKIAQQHNEKARDSRHMTSQDTSLDPFGCLLELLGHQNNNLGTILNEKIIAQRLRRPKQGNLEKTWKTNESSRDGGLFQRHEGIVFGDKKMFCGELEEIFHLKL